jgi:transcriptional regulator with XRE-family HTH domain
LNRVYLPRIVVAVTGAEMRRIRRALGLTQAELAERIGIKPNSVARQERGEIGISQPVALLVRLAGETARPGRKSRH